MDIIGKFYSEFLRYTGGDGKIYEENVKKKIVIKLKGMRNIPEYIANLMIPCLSFHPNERPTFLGLYQKYLIESKRGYITLSSTGEKEEYRDSYFKLGKEAMEMKNYKKAIEFYENGMGETTIGEKARSEEEREGENINWVKLENMRNLGVSINIW